MKDILASAHRGARCYVIALGWAAIYRHTLQPEQQLRVEKLPSTESRVAPPPDVAVVGHDLLLFWKSTFLAAVTVDGFIQSTTKCKLRTASS